MLNDTELAMACLKVMETNSQVSRNVLRKTLHTSNERLQRLESIGLIKLPPKTPKNACSNFFKKKNHWRGFKLFGSPDSKRKKSEYDKKLQRGVKI